MEKRFFTEEEFIENYDEEIDKAVELYASIFTKGIRDNALCTFDFDFSSDKKTKLEELGNLLRENYGFEVGKIKKEGKYWVLEGVSCAQPYNEERLVYWALDLYARGYEFDCMLTGYGALIDPENIEYFGMGSESADDYYKKGIDLINKGNFGAAIIYFSLVIELDPVNAKPWYAKGYCKEQIYSFAAARKDYDEAIELDPNFIDALIARGANYDDQGEYEDALKDYNKVLGIEPDNDMAYFNRGNTKFNMGDKKGACEDWIKAKSLGSPYAEDRIVAECK